MPKSQWWSNWKQIRGNLKWKAIETAYESARGSAYFRWGSVPAALVAVSAWLKAQGTDTWILIFVAGVIALLIVAVAVGWAYKRLRNSRIDPVDIEDYPVHDALNLKITNRSRKEELTRSVLYLARATLWSDKWKGYRTVNELKVAESGVILGDQLGLPKGATRIFQLVNFADARKPVTDTISTSDNTYCHWVIPRKGIWRFELQLRWDGGLQDVVKCFSWSDTSLPAFIECPIGRLLPGHHISQSESADILADNPVPPNQLPPVKVPDIQGSIYRVNLREHPLTSGKDGDKRVLCSLRLNVSLYNPGQEIEIVEFRVPVRPRGLRVVKGLSVTSRAGIPFRLKTEVSHDFSVDVQIEFQDDGSKSIPLFDLLCIDQYGGKHYAVLESTSLPELPSD